MSAPARGRLAAPEWMDEPDVDRAELLGALRHLARFNRWLGGTRTVLAAVRPLLAAAGNHPVRVLDVATGYADFPLALARWGERAGVALEIVATDLHPTAVALAAAHAGTTSRVRCEVADARALPYPDRSFEVATCNTALHHFDDVEAVGVLRELARVASQGVVVSDLRRGRIALWGAQLMAATLWRGNRLNRHDGPLSVRRAWTATELRALAIQAGLAGARVRSGPLRLLLSWRRPAGG